jgi:hypothetical protein
MRYERYRRIENAITASDKGGIWERWRYGRRLRFGRRISRELRAYFEQDAARDGKRGKR